MPNMRIDMHGVTIQLEIPTEKHQYRPETARLTYWEHKAMPRQNGWARELPKHADGTHICAQRFQGVDKI